jgi:hypothetical protein
MPQSAKQHTLWAEGAVGFVPPGAKAAEALARRSKDFDVLICLSRIRRSSKCADTIEPWECVAIKIASAPWRSSTHSRFAVRLLYSLQIKTNWYFDSLASEGVTPTFQRACRLFLRLPREYASPSRNAPCAAPETLPVLGASL